MSLFDRYETLIKHLPVELSFPPKVIHDLGFYAPPGPDLYDFGPDLCLGRLVWVNQDCLGKVQTLIFTQTEINQSHQVLRTRCLSSLGSLGKIKCCGFLLKAGQLVNLPRLPRLLRQYTIYSISLSIYSSSKEISSCFYWIKSCLGKIWFTQTHLGFTQTKAQTFVKTIMKLKIKDTWK